MQYVYPVVSRRAGGVSVGINLNPNNACNWRCVYCQVPDLVRGNAPELDLPQLADELDRMLESIVHGDFMTSSVPEQVRRLNDIALSGNGEPTSSRQFAEVIELIAAAMQKFDLIGAIKLVLITNGSQMYKPAVQQAVTSMHELGGEVWFKFDRAPVNGFSEVNQINISREQIERHLLLATQACTTWIQTCMFAFDGELPTRGEISDWLDVLQSVRLQGGQIAGVLLYGVARPSMQPEASRIKAAPADWMSALAEQIQAAGFEVKLSL
ncbi:hypothetical protein KSF73_11445 [Burkholderiaceae bacterium DAT-1]|nr:hypothetical protein [Burkholderiaceae bacterium DAT-1]